MNLLSLGISNFADSPGKRKDFLDTFPADLVATSWARSYSERNTNF